MSGGIMRSYPINTAQPPQSPIFAFQEQQLYRCLREAIAMHKFILFLVALVSITEGLLDASTSKPSTQNVRFAQEITPSNLVIPPHVLTHPRAAYTDEARQRGIQGNVIVQAQFDIDGNFVVLKVMKGLGYGLDESALTALQQWRFSPALRDGLPVSAVAEIEVPFRLVDPERLREMQMVVADQLGTLVKKWDDLKRLHQRTDELEHVP